MNLKNYLFIVSIFLVLLVLIILTYIMPDKIAIKVIKDVAITATLTFSFSFSFKLHVSYKKYETDIKAMIIQNQNIYLGEKQDARTSFLLDKDNAIIQQLINTYRQIEWYFKDYDFTSPHHGDLFTELMNLCDGEYKDSTYRFSDSELNELLEQLKNISIDFVGFMSANVYPNANNMFVTKYWDKRREGYKDEDLKDLISIDEKLYKKVKEMIKVYKNIIDMFYEKYTPHSIM